MFGSCHAINLSLNVTVSVLPSARATTTTVRGVATSHMSFPRRTSLQLYPAEYGFGNGASKVPPFVSRSANLCVWVYASAVFLMFPRATTRWPSHKIPICCCHVNGNRNQFSGFWRCFSCFILPCVIGRVLGVVSVNP